MNKPSSYVAHYKPYFLAATETWASAEVPDSVLTLKNFVLLGRDRIGQKGGGIFLYVHNKLKSFSSVVTKEDVCI